MGEIESFLDHGTYSWADDEGSAMQKNTELLLYFVLGFCAPIFFAQPQLLVVSAVNLALVLAALNLRDWRLVPVILVPIAGLFVQFRFFGSFAPYIVYMVPFACIANAILVMMVKYFVFWRGSNRIGALFGGAFLKTAFLLGSAYALTMIGLIPESPLGSLAMVQLQGALIGGGAALVVQEIRTRI